MAAGGRWLGPKSVCLALGAGFAIGATLGLGASAILHPIGKPLPGPPERLFFYRSELSIFGAYAGVLVAMTIVATINIYRSLSWFSRSKPQGQSDWEAHP